MEEKRKIELENEELKIENPKVDLEKEEENQGIGFEIVIGSGKN